MTESTNASLDDFTPGPWRAFGYEVVNVDDLVVATTTTTRLPHPEERANARLIAAAPEMLATLKDVIAHLRSITLDPGEDEDDAPALTAAEALIAKAEGRQP